MNMMLTTFPGLGHVTVKIQRMTNKNVKTMLALL
jgi:hypothetical protein